jgi:RIO kinase 1
MEEVVLVTEPPPTIPPVVEYEEEHDDDDDDDLSLSSDSDIAEALDWLDGKDDDELIGGGFSLHARRPNAHGGHGSRPNSSSLQPISNKAQKLTSHVRASPLELLNCS